MKKSLFITIPLISLSLFSCGSKIPNKVEFEISDITSTEIHTTLQNEYINSDNPDTFFKQNDTYENNFGYKSQSSPLGIEVSYNIKTDNGASGSYKVITSEVEDFTDAYEHPANSKRGYLYNLKFNTKYYYKVKATYKSVTFESEVKEFTTSDSIIRNIYADGVENIRDIGGFKTESGKVMKQGKIYRSAQFNYNRSDESAIKSAPTSKGKNVLLNQLGIKTEVDVREKKTSKGKDETCGIKSSPLGASVNYVNLPMKFGGGNVITNTSNTESFKSFLELCADESNYPLVFHCVRGTDRTGAMAFALGALCGVSEGDLLKDYLFSNFSNIGSTYIKSRDFALPYAFSMAEGETMSEKAKYYLNDNLGVSYETLERIIDILTE